MSKQKRGIAAYLVLLLFFLYFAILFAERLQSLLRSFLDMGRIVFSTGFGGLVYGLCILSMVTSLAALLIFNRPFLASVFSGRRDARSRVRMGALCNTAGLLLVSGMLHTEYTIPAIQFAAYGALIAALILHTAYYRKTANNKPLLWLSLVYLIAFSMAIPVVYPTTLAYAALFYAIEILTALLLIAAFTQLLCRVMTTTATNLFHTWHILVAIIGDGAILLLRRQEKINFFVLIFLLLSILLWCAGKLLTRKSTTI